MQYIFFSPLFVPIINSDFSKMDNILISLHFFKLPQLREHRGDFIKSLQNTTNKGCLMTRK